jgi:hypothetical protein
MFLRFMATSIEPFPIREGNELQTLTEYSAMLIRISREYDRAAARIDARQPVSMDVALDESGTCRVELAVVLEVAVGCSAGLHEQHNSEALGVGPLYGYFLLNLVVGESTMICIEICDRLSRQQSHQCWDDHQC